MDLFFWDTGNDRPKWRQLRLAMNKRFAVKVPIRYGRKSASREGTYTMVLSPFCDHGGAIVVECRKSISSSTDLITEAICLWEVEGGVKNSVSGTWGSVGILVNPSSNVDKEIVHGWTGFVCGQKNYGNFPHHPQEGAIVSNVGVLNLRWPNLSSGGQLALDLLLAPVTAPSLEGTPPNYPSVLTIAEAWKSNPSEDYYFWNNRRNGITTYQDAMIEQVLRE